ncbi:MAG: Gfo/Idh/MocA family oxidoreductase [Clostridia bacterium]|nr:Gfo/Idh/MocA family oxidoreductase [Clostridia bacterium]
MAIRIGSIGLGGISSGVHVPGIQASPDLVLTALCDIDKDRLLARAKEYGIPEDHCFTDYRDLIACPDVDAIDISTPNDVHMEIAIAAAQAGKPYGIEKPMTMDTPEALKLQAATREAGVSSMIYFSYRYKAAARFMRHLVRSGVIGKVHHVSMQYYQEWGLAIKDCPLVWRYDKKVAASGALGDLGCHGLDLVSFVTGESYQAVTAHLDTIVHERKLPGSDAIGTVDVDDFSNILAKMTGGISATFQISRFAFGRGNYQRMEIYGEKGALVYHLDRLPGKDELEIANDETGGVYTAMEIPQEMQVSQMQCFADLLRGKDDGLNATVDDGVTSEILLDGILKASEEGRWITL